MGSSGINTSTSEPEVRYTMIGDVYSHCIQIPSNIVMARECYRLFYLSQRNETRFGMGHAGVTGHIGCNTGNKRYSEDHIYFQFVLQVMGFDHKMKDMPLRTVKFPPWMNQNDAVARLDYMQELRAAICQVDDLHGLQVDAVTMHVSEKEAHEMMAFL